jgi:hypothetical protein
MSWQRNSPAILRDRTAPDAHAGVDHRRWGAFIRALLNRRTPCDCEPRRRWGHNYARTRGACRAGQSLIRIDGRGRSVLSNAVLLGLSASRLESLLSGGIVESGDCVFVDGAPADPCMLAKATRATPRVTRLSALIATTLGAICGSGERNDDRVTIAVNGSSFWDRSVTTSCRPSRSLGRSQGLSGKQLRKL